MASKLLLPGFGGAYTTLISAVSTNSTGTDTIDCSRCDRIVLSLGSSTGTPSVQLQQTFDLFAWVNINTVVTVASGGIYGTYLPTAGPFGVVRPVMTLAAGTCTLTLTGFPVPVKW